jgi:cytochrome b pre-mRNA-processing protein 3
MIFDLFRRRAPEPPSPAETIYAGIVADARRPAFYRELSAPDTLPGRFELIVLHVALYLRRLRNGGGEAEALSQQLFDEMFRAMDASLRELGVGDLSVPKRIKAMVASFYDGAAAYDVALDAKDLDALAGALRRIVYRQAATGDAPDRLAAYMFSADEALAGQPLDVLLTRGPAFPAIEGFPP